MEKLPIEFKNKWTAALRSGEFPQAKASLYDGKGFCCLGVACVVAGIAREDILEGTIPFAGRSGFNKLPDELKWDNADLGNVKAASINDTITKLAGMNDQFNKSFAEIADFIDENL